MDELLKNKKINNFIYTTHNSKEKLKEIKTDENPENKESIIKLRFETWKYDFDLEQIDLSVGGEGTLTTIFEHRIKKNKNKNGEMNCTADESKLNQSNKSKLSKNSFELNN